MSCLDPEIFKNPSQVENFVCASGMGVPFKPVLDSCGHTYCWDCYRKILFSENSTCPFSRRALNQDLKTIRKNHTLSFLDEEEIKCSNYEKGCEWNAKLKNLETHLYEECSFASLPCTYFGCNQFIFTREELQNHRKACMLRPIECRFCKETYQKRREKHHCEKECLELPRFCHSCQDYIAQFDKNDHSKNCPSRKRQCPYAELNCAFEGNLKQIKDHLKDPVSVIDHLSKQTKMILSLSKEIAELKTKLSKFEEKKPDEVANTEIGDLFG